MCATWWKRIPERSVYERPSSVTIGKVCHRKVNVYTSLSAEENVFFVVVGGSRDPCHTRFPLSFHPMYRHIVRTLFNRFANIHCPSSIFVNRERKRETERERNFSFDTSPWRSISPSTRLFSSSTFLYFVCRAFWTELIRDNRCSFTMSLLFFFYIVGQKLKKFY